MKKFIISERVTMTRRITVEGDSMLEVRKKYENGDYYEELEACYFDGGYDDINCTIQSEDGYYSIVSRDYSREDEEEEDW